MIAAIEAPAKINLGLEILGKRPDGFHEIRTILQMVDIVDEVRVRFSNHMSLTCDDPVLDVDDNLALKAARLWSEQIDPLHRAIHVDLVKRIPAAAGLGGASSDAASVLILAEELANATADGSGAGYQPPASGERLARLHEVAAQLGSDVPFFLGPTAAFAHGRGELLDPVTPHRDTLIVLATPDLVIDRKTATMYGALDQARDFTDGTLIDELRAVLNANDAVPPRLLFNAFARPLLALYPELAKIAEIMGFYAGGRAGLSGAGPTWYALVDRAPDAQALVHRLTSEVSTARIVVARPLPEPPRVTIGSLA